LKRSDFFIRLTTGVLFLAVACYIGVYLFNALINTYATEPAISYSIEETLPAQGFIVRPEAVLDDIGLTVLPIVGEGEKVAAGQAIAVEYLSNEALETASEIRALRLKIAQLEAAQGTADAASFDAILELSAAVNINDMRRLDEISLNVETSVFAVETDIALLQNRLDVLEDRSDGARIVIAQVSGTFSYVVDGFEHISPDIIYGISPSDLSAQFRMPIITNSTGKLVTEFKWYFAAIMDSDDAAQLSAGQTNTVQFFGNFNQ